MNTEIITFINFILGIATVTLSLVVAALFAFRASRFSSGANKRFTWALVWQLVGEATIGAGTLIFAAAAHVGILDSWSVQVQSGIRFVMFFATSVTTLHLFRTIKKIQELP